MIEWITSKFQNFVIITAIASSLLGAVYLWVKDKLKDFKHSRELKDERKDADIANEPSKRGSDLIDGL